MTFPNALRPAARSAYRSVIRSARVTFEGDPARHVALVNAVRETFTSPTLTPPKPTTPREPEPTSCSSASTPPPPPPPVEDTQQAETEVSYEELEKRIGEWKEIALFLRRNVVQGERGEDGSYRLRVTKDTELGDNETIKTPPKLPTTPFPNRNRARRRRTGGAQATATATAESQPAGTA